MSLQSNTCSDRAGGTVAESCSLVEIALLTVDASFCCLALSVLICISISCKTDGSTLRCTSL